MSEPSEWNLQDSEDEAHRETECGHHGKDEGANEISKNTVRAARGDCTSTVPGLNLKMPQKPSQKSSKRKTLTILNDH